MKRDDVLKVDELKATIERAFLKFSQELRGVFGELVYSVDTIVERYNDLETKHGQLEQRLNTVTERLLVLEKHLGEH